MNIYKFYVSTADKDKLIKIKPDREFITEFDFFFENYTLQIAQGRYTMSETDTVITEKTFIVTVIENYSDEMLKWIVEQLKQHLNQESILVTISRDDFKFM